MQLSSTDEEAIQMLLHRPLNFVFFSNNWCWLKWQTFISFSVSHLNCFSHTQWRPGCRLSCRSVFNKMLFMNHSLETSLNMKTVLRNTALSTLPTLLCTWWLWILSLQDSGFRRKREPLCLFVIVNELLRSKLLLMMPSSPVGGAG